MICYFSKSLDRPVSIIGLRGKWLIVFLCSVGVCILLGIIVGSMMGSGIGVSVAIAGGVAAFMLIYMTQGKISHRDLDKLSSMSGCRTYVRRKETLCRIILSSQDSPSWFASAQRERDAKSECSMIVIDECDEC